MSGQSVLDRMTAVKHSIAGQGLAKAVCKSTTEEVMGPKKKHLDCKLTFKININLISVSLNLVIAYILEELCFVLSENFETER